MDTDRALESSLLDASCLLFCLPIVFVKIFCSTIIVILGKMLSSPGFYQDFLLALRLFPD